MNKPNKTLIDLVDNLPEVYQPIFGHAEFQYDISRICDDRLIQISEIYNLLAKKLDRPLRVLDLGCAQGFFSLSLAKMGATVQGIDYLDKNIAVCQALAKENHEFSINFNIGRIEDIFLVLQKDQYDLVLGLSVFHHIVYEHGLPVVQNMLAELAQKIKVGIFELALSEEPLYWGPSQAKIPRDSLKGFSFVHEVKKYSTHLSHLERPLIVASNFYWILNNKIGTFDSFLEDSHQLAKGTHQLTRKYFFTENNVIKIYRLDNKCLLKDNINEFKNEVNFLLKFSKIIHAPELILYGENESEAWLVREKLEGKLLLDIITNKGNYDSNVILDDVLKQLVALEHLGLYHGDLRVWNVLVNEDGHAMLIDFGSISTSSKDCVQPDNIFLSFFTLINEIIEHKVIKPDIVRDIKYDINMLPEPYRSAFIQLFALPEEEVSFNKLFEFISLYQDSPHAMPSGLYILQEAETQVSTTYKNAIIHCQAKANEAEAKANEAYIMLLNTTSWKITRPLRYLNRIRKGIIKRFNG